MRETWVYSGGRRFRYLPATHTFEENLRGEWKTYRALPPEKPRQLPQPKPPRYIKTFRTDLGLESIGG